ncbi:MAG: YihY/virulence factor BrkB family protein [Actinomycetota bacterium]|nr:YihY/virulence factor BrkB family protein [Actinomycetota bacterium]
MPAARADVPVPASGGDDVVASSWRTTLRQLQAHVKRDRLSVSAGSLAYHGFLAFFPAVIAALGILDLVHLGTGSLRHLAHGIVKALPPGAAGVFQTAVHAATRRSAGSVVAVVVGIFVGLWSSTSAMAVLQQVLDMAYEVPADRKFMARRLRGVPLLVLTGLLGSSAAALIVFGKPIGSAIDGTLPFGGPAFTLGWTVLRWVVAFALVSVLFSAYYAYGPYRRRPAWRWASPGSLLASGVFLVGSLGFSYYVSSFGSYGKTYGSFAGVAIFIFWMYLAALAVLLGGELNAQLEREGRSGLGVSRTRSRSRRGDPSG